MPIRVLDPHIAERIAAGEVIERPASVVKELVENSLDAGATEIQIVLEDGGKGLIEITDNGHGMGPEDLALSVKRHATSKLRSLEDLEKIATLGFRGEALPSVAAVSDLTLLSRTSDCDTAYEFVAGPFEAPKKPKPATFGHFLNSPHGTRIRAVGLFSQVPARLKFLKSQSAEVSQVREWVERLALSHPGTGFKLMSGDRTVLNLRPAKEIDRVHALLSDGDTDFPILTDSTEPRAAIGARAYWLQGYSAPQLRKLVQVVNGRAVRDRLLQQAILQPFRQALMPGQFPAVALFLELPPSELDVNVHPTKSEIRFLNSRVVFEAVQNLVSSMIGRNGAPAYATTRPASDHSWGGGNWTRNNWSPPAPSNSSPWESATAASPGDAAPAPQEAAPAAASVFGASENSLTELAPSLPLSGSTESGQPSSLFGSARHPLETGRFVGILFNTYLAYDLGQELALVDQHAADERIRYERLRKRVLERGAAAPPASQALLIPEPIRFPPEHRAELEARLAWLTQLGFEVELFSDDTVLFRGIPEDWSNQSLKVRLKGLVDRVLEFDSAGGPDHRKHAAIDETLFETLAREACHSAVRAGDRLEPRQAMAIVEQLFACEHPWNCPHGRPTLVRVARGKIEEWFQRRI